MEEKVSREQAKALMGQLHELFGKQDPTPQQQELMRKLEQHIHGVGEPDVDSPNLVESLEVAVEDLETDHPRTAGVMREILNILRSIGV